MTLPTYYFYCGECEAKTKAILFFRTWCPCHEATVLATNEYIEYQGLAVPQEDWEKSDESIPPIIGPRPNLLTVDFVRRHR